jgi:hypothetical protein
MEDRMRLAPLILLSALGCGSNTDPLPGHGVLETNATSYVASPLPTGAFDFDVPVVVTLRNTSEELIRVSRCLATANHPPYFLEATSGGQVAWSPTYSCDLQRPKLQDLLPGDVRTDTLRLVAPWQRSFNGQPIGAVQGEFRLVIETQICRAIAANGNCQPLNQLEYQTSNKFRITTR